MKNELTITSEPVSEKKLIEYLDVMGISPKLTESEKIQFLNIAMLNGLNPFKREIFCSVYGTGEYKQLSIITGYEVYIKRAERSGQLDGWHATTSGSVLNRDLKAIVTIHRKDRKHPFVWEVFYEECVQKTKSGAVTKFWEKSNFMTKKVAISQAFRLCFSDELGGMPYTSDEMPQQTEDVLHELVNDIVETETIILVPDLSEEDLKKTLNAKLPTIQRCLSAITDGKLNATTEQILRIRNKISELNF